MGWWAPLLLFAALLPVLHAVYAVDAKIWDNDAEAWTDTFGDGDPIDAGAAVDSDVVAKAPNGQVFVAFRASDGTYLRVYMSRYSGTQAQIWDNGTAAWTDQFTLGDPIDTRTATRWS